MPFVALYVQLLSMHPGIKADMSKTPCTASGYAYFMPDTAIAPAAIIASLTIFVAPAYKEMSLRREFKGQGVRESGTGLTRSVAARFAA